MKAYKTTCGAAQSKPSDHWCSPAQTIFVAKTNAISKLAQVRHKLKILTNFSTIPVKFLFLLQGFSERHYGM